MIDQELLTPKHIDMFFSQLNTLECSFMFWTGSKPKKLFINPKIIGALVKIPGFYQRPELQSEVTVYSPVVRHFKLGSCVVEIKDDYYEAFMHLE